MASNNQKNKQPEKKSNTTVIVTICVAVLVTIGVSVGLIISGTGTAETTAPSDTLASGDLAETTAPSDEQLHHVSIEIADYGTITLELDASAAPITVQNFLDLAGSGFYDGLTFHRIMKDFMMQGGDPEGTGNGGSDTTIKGEFSTNGVDNPISHTRGTISMARSQAPDSASSQFFICQQDSTYLDGSYAAFGHVTEGMDVVDAICNAAQPTDNNGTIPADQQPVMTKVTVID